eukprot:364415-Chlamydomonas_euryale.AAC.1
MALPASGDAAAALRLMHRRAPRGFGRPTYSSPMPPASGGGGGAAVAAAVRFIRPLPKCSAITLKPSGLARSSEKKRSCCAPPAASARRMSETRLLRCGGCWACGEKCAVLLDGRRQLAAR